MDKLYTSQTNTFGASISKTSQAATGSISPRQNSLEEMDQFVQELIKTASNIEENLTAFGYRIIGNNDLVSTEKSVPQPVPNGAIQRVQYGLGDLHRTILRISSKVHDLHTIA